MVSIDSKQTVRTKCCVACKHRLSLQGCAHVCGLAHDPGRTCGDLGSTAPWRTLYSSCSASFSLPLETLPSFSLLLPWSQSHACSLRGWSVPAESSHSSQPVLSGTPSARSSRRQTCGQSNLTQRKQSADSVYVCICMYM